MTKPDTSSLPHSIRIAGWILSMLLLLVSAPAGARAAAPGQQTFASPEQAAEALAAAWRSDSKPDLVKIFGPAGVKLVSSGDEVADKNAKEQLAAAYDAQHSIVGIGDKKAQLIIGKEEFPFPIPLVKRGNAWRFDTQAGAEEILDRRIGRNELNAIGVCRAYIEAQREYAAKDRSGNGPHEYAMKIASADDRHDGLYWQAKQGEEESPLGPLIASAADEGYSSAGKEAMLSPYHGYYYRILTRQGPHAPGGALNYVAKDRMTEGFSLVAYPAEYGNSGIMTFIVNQDGIVFEKNLGPHTAKIARQMTQYDPDRSWKIHH
jgi:hypothetical protein